MATAIPSARRPTISPARWLPAAALTVITVTAVTACSAAPAPVRLPRRPAPAAAPAAHSSPAVPPEDQVWAAWLAFWAAGTAADKTLSAARASVILAATAAPSYVSKVIQGMQADWAKDEVTYGQPVEHKIKVSIVTVGGAEQAFVTDCQDAAGTGLANARTGQHIAGTAGAPHAELYGDLGLVDGRWLVGNVTFVGTQCTG